MALPLFLDEFTIQKVWFLWEEGIADHIPTSLMGSRSHIGLEGLKDLVKSHSMYSKVTYLLISIFIYIYIYVYYNNYNNNIDNNNNVFTPEIPIPKPIPHGFLAVREALHCFEDVVSLVGMGKKRSPPAARSKAANKKLCFLIVV